MSNEPEVVIYTACTLISPRGKVIAYTSGPRVVMAGHYEALEAKAYALEDQVKGLQELMDQTPKAELGQEDPNTIFRRVFAEEATKSILKLVLPDLLAAVGGRVSAPEYRKVLAKLLSIRDPEDDRIGDPRHCHKVMGRWDEDGSLCESCAVYEEARALLARDSVAPLPPESANREKGPI